MPQSPEDRPAFYSGGGDPRIKRSGGRAQNQLVWAGADSPPRLQGFARVQTVEETAVGERP